jgi:hypothetical protein
LQKKTHQTFQNAKRRLASSVSAKNIEDDEELSLTFLIRFCLSKSSVEKAGESSSCDSSSHYSSSKTCFRSLGVMLPPLPSMKIHFDLNFTKKNAKHHLYIQETNFFQERG